MTAPVEEAPPFEHQPAGLAGLHHETRPLAIRRRRIGPVHPLVEVDDEGHGRLLEPPKTRGARQVAELAGGERADVGHITQALDRLMVGALPLVLRGAHVLHDDAPAPAQHARHLPQDRAGVGEMVEGVAAHRHVEGPSREGQPLDIPLQAARADRHGLADHLTGQIDPADVKPGARERRGHDPRPAGDVERPLAAHRAEELHQAPQPPGIGLQGAARERPGLARERGPHDGRSIPMMTFRLHAILRDRRPSARRKNLILPPVPGGRPGRFAEIGML